MSKNRVFPGPSPAEWPPLRIRYRNRRGQVAWREVRPLTLWYGCTEYHPEPQWLLNAIAIDRGVAIRDFALADILEFARPEDTP